MASNESGRGVPTLISTEEEIAAKCAASSHAMTIAGDAPIASNTFAVISCTTSLVMQCTSGATCLTWKRCVAMVSGSTARIGGKVNSDIQQKKRDEVEKSKGTDGTRQHIAGKNQEHAGKDAL